MVTKRKKDLVHEVTRGARGFVTNTLLFRHVIAETLGINAADSACLGLIFFKGFATPSAIARHAGLSSGATTAMLDRLEKAKLIERRPNPDDRRSVHIVIEKKTAEKVTSLYASVRKAQDKLVSKYSKEELELLSVFFRGLSAVWEEEGKKLAGNFESRGTDRYGRYTNSAG